MVEEVTLHGLLTDFAWGRPQPHERIDDQIFRLGGIPAEPQREMIQVSGVAHVETVEVIHRCCKEYSWSQQTLRSLVPAHP